MTVAARRGTYKPRGPKTAGGALLPYGWNLVRYDTFGTGGSVPDYATLHQFYNEGQYYNTNYDGTINNSTINGQQQTYQHFETSIAISTDHLTIQGRGQSGGAIWSAQMCSKYADRSFVWEAKFQTPSTAGTWLEFWAYPQVASGTDASELDVEVVQSVSGPETVHEVFFNNHGDSAANLIAPDTADFDVGNMRWIASGYDASAASHTYTMYYDDTGAGTIRRYLDGVLMYAGTWKWMQSLGGTGFGPDAVCTIDLAVGGSWPGNVTSPATWTGDLNIYSIGLYTKRPLPNGQGWNQGHRSGGIQISSDYLTASKRLNDSSSETVYASISKSSGLWYWEVILSGSTNVGAGIGTNVASYSSGRYLGEDSNTLGWYGNSSGQVDTNNAVAAHWQPYDTTGGSVRLCFALDLNHFKIWGRLGATGNWNNDVLANQNPATNTGGYSLPTALQSNIVPVAALYSTSTPDAAVGAFSSGSIVGTPPSGFSAFS